MSETVPPTTEWPEALRKYLNRQVLARMHRDHEGYAGLMQWLAYGQDLGGERIPFGATIAYLYPRFLAEAEAWASKQDAGSNPS